MRGVDGSNPRRHTFFSMVLAGSGLVALFFCMALGPACMALGASWVPRLGVGALVLMRVRILAVRACVFTLRALGFNCLASARAFGLFLALFFVAWHRARSRFLASVHLPLPI